MDDEEDSENDDDSTEEPIGWVEPETGHDDVDDISRAECYAESSNEDRHTLLLQMSDAQHVDLMQRLPQGSMTMEAARMLHEIYTNAVHGPTCPEAAREIHNRYITPMHEMPRGSNHHPLPCERCGLGFRSFDGLMWHESQCETRVNILAEARRPFWDTPSQHRHGRTPRLALFNTTGTPNMLTSMLLRLNQQCETLHQNIMNVTMPTDRSRNTEVCSLQAAMEIPAYINSLQQVMAPFVPAYAHRAQAMQMMEEIAQAQQTAQGPAPTMPTAQEPVPTGEQLAQVQLTHDASSHQQHPAPIDSMAAQATPRPTPTALTAQETAIV